jgi:hypothetical protein
MLVALLLLVSDRARRPESDLDVVDASGAAP